MKSNGRHSKVNKANRRWAREAYRFYRRADKQASRKQRRSPDPHKNPTL